MGIVRFVTFGCKANQYDTQVLREALTRRGWNEGSDGADLVVMNTCTVTAEAGRKARQLARRIHRETPATKIAMIGCLAESEPDVLRDLPGVEWVLTGGEAKRPVNFLRELGEELSPEELGIPYGITEFHGHTRAFLKIQDGCDMACSYCIIPKVRGASRSRSIEELSAEVQRLVISGHVEIVLCGIHIGHWGRDFGMKFSDLIRALAETEARDENGEIKDFRLRLSSIEATEVSDELLGLLSERPDRIAPHLHMPLQSGDDSVLKAMNRWYTGSEYLERCLAIREALDEPAFTTDVIVGHPGEEELHFGNSLRILQSGGFSKVHVFPFSARPGTASYGAPNAVPGPAMRERRMRLGDLSAQLARDFRERLAGKIETVVPEGAAGLSGRYQRVRLDPFEWPGVMPALVEVRLELEERGSDEESRLIGHPLPISTEAVS
ncbi:MAG: threonylcarbamoyladenosine tRNA methylthiotransferase MtaB [Planctomycetota bacterium]|jgi:threonylcarbamoyladenosine tRNA methylthiotransferase MtaB